MQLFKRLLILVSLTICAPAQARPITATVYDSWYNGRTTYCGQTYEHWGISAAHPWLPCGTRGRVSRHGRSVLVPRIALVSRLTGLPQYKSITDCQS